MKEADGGTGLSRAAGSRTQRRPALELRPVEVVSVAEDTEADGCGRAEYAGHS